MGHNYSPLVLIVDDDEFVRRVERAVLLRAGYRVEEAPSGAHALTLIKAGLAPDLVLLDLVMPGLSGEEFVERIRTLRWSQKVLFVTGYAERFKRLPASIKREELVFLDKPFRSAALLDAVAAMLARHSSEWRIEPGALVSVVM